MKGIIRFLKTNTPKDKLVSALKVLKEFKSLESNEEWLQIPFYAWIKFEQLEEYLEHLVNGADLKDDTKKHLQQ